MINEFLQRFENVKPASKNNVYRCTCPSHGSSKNSGLMIFDHVDRIGIYCHAGCDYQDILSCVGLEAKNLYSEETDDSEWRSLRAEKHHKEARERAMHPLYAELCIIQQCLKARLFSGEPNIEGKWDAWDREKQALAKLPSLIKRYYK